MSKCFYKNQRRILLTYLLTITRNFKKRNETLTHSLTHPPHLSPRAVRADLRRLRPKDISSSGEEKAARSRAAPECLAIALPPMSRYTHSHTVRLTQSHRHTTHPPAREGASCPSFLKFSCHLLHEGVLVSERMYTLQVTTQVCQQLLQVAAGGHSLESKTVEH